LRIDYAAHDYKIQSNKSISQNNNDAYRFQERKRLIATWYRVQRPVNAGSRKLGMRTAGPSVDYRSH